MIRHLIAAPLKLALSATLALALSITPVSANDWGSRNDHDDTAKVLGLLLGIATIGALLSNKDDRHDDRVKPRKPHKPYKRVHRDRVPKHLVLPKDCVRTYRTQQGKRTLFSNQCLKRNFKYYNNLPPACKANVVARNNQGTYVKRKVFRPSCLNNRGYRLAKFY